MIGRPIVLHHRQHRRKITQVVGRVLTFVGCRMEYTSGSKCIVLLAILLVSACGGGDKGVGSTEAAEPNQAPGPPMTGPYEPLEWINVSPGRIVWRPLSSIPLTCLGWTEVTVNGVTYRIHFSHWQRKQSSDRGWTDIPGTRRVRRLCGYTPIATGEYRLVMELSIDEVRGRYASSNVIVAFCDGSACRYFEL